MACCVVLTRLPQDLLGDDSQGNAAGASRTVAPVGRPNPQAAAVVVDVSTPAASAPEPGPDDERDDGRDDAEASFKEPWSKLLSLAKEKAKVQPQQSHSRMNEVAKRKKKAVLSEPKHNDGESKPSIPEKKSMANKCQTSKSQSEEVPSVETPLRQERVSRRSQTKKKTRKRASSCEWDYSGSESRNTPAVPQNKKKKTARRSRRDGSIEMDWYPNESDSGCSGSEAGSNEFDAFHQCTICKLKFKRPWRLRIHLQQHLQPELRPFKCDADGCAKAYYYKTHLDRHKSISHADLVIKFSSKCPSEGCHKIFDTQSGLKRHINKMHSEENLKFQCPHCEKKFSKNKQLRFHIAEHKGEPPLRCKECKAGVFSDKELKRHMRTHKEYPCDVSGCDKVFPTFPAFQKHKSEHNKCFKSMKCAHCNKEFRKRSDLRNHVMTHLDQRTIFKCTYDSCPRFYYQERNLRSHIRVYHEKTSSFACSWDGCDKQFFSKQALEKHLRVHEFGVAEWTRKEGPKAPRRDKGKPKRAMATQLAGMPVHRGVEKALLAPDRTVEICESKDDESPASSGRSRRRHASKSKRVKSKQSTSASAPSEQDTSCASGSANVVNEDNLVLHEEADVFPLPVEENESIISSLTGKIFEIGEDGVLVEVERSSKIIAENVLTATTSSLPEEHSLEIEDGAVVLDLGEIPIVSEKVIISDFSLTADKDVGVLDTEEETAHLAQSSELGNNILNQDCIQKSLQQMETNETDDVAKSIAAPLCDEEGSASGMISAQRTATSSMTEVNLVHPQNDYQIDGDVEGSQSECTLSATLCAETIINGSHGESEIFLLIPGQKLSADEAMGDAVVKALSGHMEVYSMAGKNATGSFSGSLHAVTENNPVKKVSADDPSVTSILQPLIQDLTNKSSLCNNVDKNTPEPAKQLIRNPANTRNAVYKLAKFIRANARQAPLKSVKHKNGRSLKSNLQGPTQQATQSDSSSVSDSDDSHSDSGSDDDHNDSNDDEEEEADDNLSGGGDGGNEDDEDGDDEDDEQAEEEDNGDEDDNEDDNDENGNDGAGYASGDDNNNNDNNESNSRDSEDEPDPESTNGHQRSSDGSDLGVDRASSPKQNTPSEDDDVCSTHSDDLVIDEDAKVTTEESEVDRNTTTGKRPAQTALPPGKDKSNSRHKSTRIKKLEVTKAFEKNTRLARRKLECVGTLTDVSTEKAPAKLVGKGTVYKSNEVESLAKKHSPKTQSKQPVRAALKRRKPKAIISHEGSESDSSGSDIIQPVKKRRCNISDDSDCSVIATGSKRPSPVCAQVKEESDADCKTAQVLKSPLHISVRLVDLNLLGALKSPPLSDSEDPLKIPEMKEPMLFLEPKIEARPSIACSQLSEQAWIRVLREASKALKLSLTAAED